MTYTRDNREKTVVLKVTGRGEGPGFWIRRRLKKQGFEKYQQGAGRPYWKKQMTFDGGLVKKYERYCQKKGLSFSCTDIKYTRSAGYRRAFFEHNGGILGRGGHYFCAYCGRIHSARKITVDHLLPIHGVSTRRSYRFFLRLLGMADVNDVQNLVPACEGCNQKKGSRGGLWILRGMLGRHNAFWYLIYLALLSALGLAFFYRGEIIRWLTELGSLVYPLILSLKNLVETVYSDIKNLI
ncbi:MAG: HNH endonuclease signature motif containing protein [Eubacterium sp.]|nr:HNH endonuclease signature motif containing protein [Eubacterium sp.]